MRWTPKDTSEWHVWFAWLPVSLLNGEVAWLERVEQVEIGRRWFFRARGSDDMHSYEKFMRGEHMSLDYPRRPPPPPKK